MNRLPDLALALAPEQLVWRSSHRQRSLAALPVVVGKVLPAPSPE